MGWLVVEALKALRGLLRKDEGQSRGTRKGGFAYFERCCWSGYTTSLRILLTSVWTLNKISPEQLVCKSRTTVSTCLNTSLSYVIHFWTCLHRHFPMHPYTYLHGHLGHSSCSNDPWPWTPMLFHKSRYLYCFHVLTHRCRGTLRTFNLPSPDEIELGQTSASTDPHRESHSPTRKLSHSILEPIALYQAVSPSYTLPTLAFFLF